MIFVWVYVKARDSGVSWRLKYASKQNMEKEKQNTWDETAPPVFIGGLSTHRVKKRVVIALVISGHGGSPKWG